MAITVGIIGCGGISRFHFDGLAKAGATIKWVCDLNKEAATPCAEQTGATYTSDFNDITGDAEVDAVFVLTNSSAHKMLCLAAINAGKAVVCEKTLAENPDDAIEIIKAAQAKGVVFFTSYMKRFLPAVQKAKELLPALGRIITSTFRGHQPWGDVWKPGAFPLGEDGRSWVVRSYGGGVLVCGGSHTFDLVGYLIGRPTRLWASTTRFDDTDAEVQTAAMLETDNGIVHYEALAHPLGRIGFLRDGWEETVEITGTQGRLNIYISKWDEPEIKTAMLVHYDEATGQSTEHRYAIESPFARAVQHYCEQIEKGEQGPQPITTGYDVDELIACAAKSAETGEAVTINWQI